MVYWSHINLFDVSVQRPRTECLCCCLHRHPLPKEDGHNVSNAQKQAKEKHNVTFPLLLIELRDSSSFRASVYSQHMATVVQHMAAAVFFQTWMENAEYSVKRPHLLPCEVKHQCFFFLWFFFPPPSKDNMHHYQRRSRINFHFTSNNLRWCECHRGLLKVITIYQMMQNRWRETERGNNRIFLELLKRICIIFSWIQTLTSLVMDGMGWITAWTYRVLRYWGK